jgi:hypothetical protein
MRDVPDTPSESDGTTEMSSLPFWIHFPSCNWTRAALKNDSERSRLRVSPASWWDNTSPGVVAFAYVPVGTDKNMSQFCTTVVFAPTERAAPEQYTHTHTRE